MGQIIWLASYPKSGNTWVRMLLNNYFDTSATGRDLSSLDLSTFGGSSKSSYRAVTDQDVDQLDDDEIAKLIPRAHSFMANRGEGVTFVKTHNLLSTYKGTPLITPSVTRSAVYVIRNPLDIVSSVADHFGMDLDRAIDFLNDKNASTAPNAGMVRQYFCSWSMNVETWTTELPFHVTLVKYEELHRSATETTAYMLNDMGVKVDQAKVARAVELSSFERLKTLENNDGFAEKSRHSDSFFREGKSGGWKDILTKDQIDRIVGPNYQQMKRFNYLPEGY